MYRVRMLEQKEVTKVEYNEVTEMVSFHVKDPDNGWEGEHRVRAVKLNAAHNDGVDLAEYITGDLWLFIDICWLDELVDQYELWWCSENIDTVDCGPDDEDGEEERFWAHTMDEEPEGGTLVHSQCVGR